MRTIKPRIVKNQKRDVWQLWVSESSSTLMLEFRSWENAMFMAGVYWRSCA